MNENQDPVLICKDLSISYYTRAGEIPEFSGISAPYEPPESPELVVDTSQSLDDCVAQILRALGV